MKFRRADTAAHPHIRCLQDGYQYPAHAAVMREDWFPVHVRLRSGAAKRHFDVRCHPVVHRAQLVSGAALAGGRPLEHKHAVLLWRRPCPSSVLADSVLLRVGGFVHEHGGQSPALGEEVGGGLLPGDGGVEPHHPPLLFALGEHRATGRLIHVPLAAAGPRHLIKHVHGKLYNSNFKNNT